jgi:hypothetical protein
VAKAEEGFEGLMFGNVAELRVAPEELALVELTVGEIKVAGLAAVRRGAGRSSG